MGKLDAASELIREGLINYNPRFKKQFSEMNKQELRKEVQSLVDEMIEMNETCVKEGLKKFSSRQELVKASIKEVCNCELEISTRTYTEFMS